MPTAITDPPTVIDEGPNWPPAAPTEPTAPAPPATPGVDPAAPYGRTPGGRIRKRPVGRRGRKPGGRTSVIGATGSQRRAPVKPKDYRPAVMGVAQVVCLPLAFRYPVDAAVISRHVEGDDTKEFPGLARSVSDLAQQHPEIAAALDRVAVAGPYTALLSGVVMLGVQLLANHNRIPVELATKLGAQDPEDIRAALAAEAARAA